MSDYDVGKALARIEREIIASMMRNMDHHRTEEDKEGKKWPQWQAMQLKSLEKFKRDNRKKYNFTKINSTIDGLIQEAYDKGGMEEEIRILKQIKRLHGNSVTNVVKAKISDIKQRLTPGVNQEFFGLNKEKVDKLIKATHSDMEKVEQAMLRKADDQYRKIIFNAQMADISGAFTYEQAVDMAAKDFLNAGLNCVEYKNGRRVTAKTYAEMAIRTANARATLMAEGEKRHQLGITTVIVGHNGSACPLCQKWLGKVLIDDVYSGGKPTDGDYPLLSTAMKEGLFHPNCRDVIGTYIPGITRLPEPPKPEERQLSFDVYNLEQKEKQAKHNAERMGRLGDNSLDPSNKKKYKHREKMWKEKVEKYSEKNELLVASLRTKSGGEYGVDWTIVKSKAYSERFNVLSENERVRAIIAKRSRNALSNRTGKNTEEIYAISLTSGKDISSIIDQHIPFGVKKTDKFLADVVRAEEHGEKILLIHNHPRGLPPSIEDLNELLTHSNAVGITVGHNGSIYYYSKPSRRITDFDFNIAFRKNKQYNGFEQYEKTVEELAKQFGFKFEVL